VSRVSDELLHCQQLQEQSDKQRKLLEAQLKDAEAKLDSVQAEHLYTSKKIVEKLEQRVRVVEMSCWNSKQNRGLVEVVCARYIVACN